MAPRETKQTCDSERRQPDFARNQDTCTLKSWHPRQGGVALFFFIWYYRVSLSLRRRGRFVLVFDRSSFLDPVGWSRPITIDEPICLHSRRF